jgi:hypothetical protein
MCNDIGYGRWQVGTQADFCYVRCPRNIHCVVKMASRRQTSPLGLGYEVKRLAQGTIQETCLEMLLSLPSRLSIGMEMQG